MFKFLQCIILGLLVTGLAACNHSDSVEKSTEAEGNELVKGIGEMVKEKGTIELSVTKETGNFKVSVLGASMGTFTPSKEYLHLFDLKEKVNILQLNLRIEHTSDSNEYLNIDKSILEINGKHYTVNSLLTSYYDHSNISYIFSGNESRDVTLYFISDTTYFVSVASAKLYVRAPYIVHNGIADTGPALEFDLSFH